MRSIPGGGRSIGKHSPPPDVLADAARVDLPQGGGEKFRRFHALFSRMSFALPHFRCDARNPSVT